MYDRADFCTFCNKDVATCVPDDTLGIFILLLNHLRSDREGQISELASQLLTKLMSFLTQSLESPKSEVKGFISVGTTLHTSLSYHLRTAQIEVYSIAVVLGQ